MCGKIVVNWLQKALGILCSSDILRPAKYYSREVIGYKFFRNICRGVIPMQIYKSVFIHVETCHSMRSELMSVTEF